MAEQKVSPIDPSTLSWRDKVRNLATTRYGYTGKQLAEALLGESEEEKYMNYLEKIEAGLLPPPKNFTSNRPVSDMFGGEGISDIGLLDATLAGISGMAIPKLSTAAALTESGVLGADAVGEYRKGNTIGAAIMGTLAGVPPLLRYANPVKNTSSKEVVEEVQPDLTRRKVSQGLGIGALATPFMADPAISIGRNLTKGVTKTIKPVTNVEGLVYPFEGFDTVRALNDIGELKKLKPEVQISTNVEKYADTPVVYKHIAFDFEDEINNTIQQVYKDMGKLKSVDKTNFNKIMDQATKNTVDKYNKNIDTKRLVEVLENPQFRDRIFDYSVAYYDEVGKITDDYNKLYRKAVELEDIDYEKGADIMNRAIELELDAANKAGKKIFGDDYVYYNDPVISQSLARESIYADRAIEAGNLPVRRVNNFDDPLMTYGKQPKP